MTNLMGTTENKSNWTPSTPDQKVIARCKANGMTLIRLAKESGKLNEQGLAMFDEVNKWLASDNCQFAQNGFQGGAPTELDMSMLQDLYKAYKATNV